MTINDLRRQERTRLKLQGDIQCEIDALRLQIDHLDKLAELAKEIGNRSECKKIQAKRDEAQLRETLLTVECMTTEKPRIAAHEVQEAWTDQQRSYNRVFNAALANLEEAKRAFVGSMETLLLLQGGALRDREELGRMMGTNPPEDLAGKFAYTTLELRHSIPTEKSPLQYQGINYSGDLAYYAYLTGNNGGSLDLLNLRRIVELRRAAK